MVLGACGPVMAIEDVAPRPDAATTPADDAAIVDSGVAVDSGAAVDAAADASAINASATTRRNTGASGELDVVIRVQNHRSLMVVANSDGAARVSVLSVVDPGGTTVFRWQDWYNAPRRTTKAIFAERTGTSFNWPIRAEDPALMDGEYSVRIGTYRVDGVTSRPNVDVDITTITNGDRDLERGRVKVALIWANGLSANGALVAATERAVAHWRTVWNGAGMDLDVRYVASTISPALPYPSATTGDLFLQASALAMDGEVPVIIGETVNNDATQYGVAGHIPGPIVRSPLRAIVVGWLANAGSDGVFSDNDVRLYGEVFAHEVGHYVGLFHPVERTYDAWDALGDTPECRNEMGCETMLGTNLMFPYSICDTNGCLSTTVLTAQQRAVMQRYTGTL
jgi:hypothetical protein